jgi:hypothetical protein
MIRFSSWAASLDSKIFQEKNLEILVSQHAEDRGTTAIVTHKHPTGLNPSAQPLESRLIFVTARAAVVLTNEIEPGHSQRKMICSVLVVKKVESTGYLGVCLHW